MKTHMLKLNDGQIHPKSASRTNNAKKHELRHLCQKFREGSYDVIVMPKKLEYKI
jgi:hypothetical protein